MEGFCPPTSYYKSKTCKIKTQFPEIMSFRDIVKAAPDEYDGVGRTGGIPAGCEKKWSRRYFMSKSRDLYTYAKTRIPGGVQLLSKRPEQFSSTWPSYFTKAKGCEVWDLDGNHYYDMTSNGIGSCLLGYADPDVVRAVVERVENGSMSTLNPPEEVWLADRLCEIHPWAENVRFARTGGETCAIAVRTARATTGRDLVAICGYHGWTDWYIAVNLADEHGLDGQLLPGLKPAGVPRVLAGSTLAFNYDNYEEFDAMMAEYGDRLACVIMEPFRHEITDGSFLRHVKESVHRHGALLIFDEITIGWRYAFGGSHMAVGITPDMATFAKAMGNGHPIGAVIGTKEAMDGAQDSFISSTYWTESVGPTAALATIDKIEKTRAWEVACRVGTAVQKDWTEAARRHDLTITCSGVPCLAHFDFKEDALEQKTLYTMLMQEEGFLGTTYIYPTLAHTDEVLSLHREAVDRVFEKMSAIAKKGGKEAILEAIGGEVCQTGFKRLLK